MKTEDNKLLEFQKRVGSIVKEETNPFFNKKYADINNIIQVIKPALNDSGLTLTQPIVITEGRQILHTYLKDGEKVIEHSEMLLPDNIDPQKMGSAITYYRRYSIQAMLLLQAEDDDGNLATKETTKETKPTAEPNAFKEMKEAKDLDTVKRIWTDNKSLQHDSVFAGLKEKRKSELTPNITTPDTNNLMTKTDLDKLQPHPLNEPDKITVDDILPEGIGEVEEVQTETFVKDAITELGKCKTVTGMNTKFREIRNNAAYLFLDDADKNKITEFCKTKKSQINEKK